MRSFTTLSTLTLIIAFLSLTLINVAKAHSWLDCVDTSSGAKTAGCNGYPRGYPGRDNGDINTLYTNRINDRNAASVICSGRQGSSAEYSSAFPMMTAHAGQSLTLSWQPNGHFQQPPHTQVRILWTGAPGDHGGVTYGDAMSSWKTLQAMEFATADTCVNPGDANTKCIGSMSLPAGISPGTYHFIWAWAFDQNPAGEEYFTCFDVNVV